MGYRAPLPTEPLPSSWRDLWRALRRTRSDNRFAMSATRTAWLLPETNPERKR